MKVIVVKVWRACVHGFWVWGITTSQWAFGYVQEPIDDQVAYQSWLYQHRQP